MRILAGVLATLVVCSGQVPQSAPLVREGDYWSQTTTGVFPCAIRGQLKIAATGAVVLRGASRDDCSFRIKQKTRAASEADARNRLRGFSIRTRSVVETAILTLNPAEDSLSILEMEVQAPRTIGSASVSTRFGELQAYDLEGAVSLESGGGPVQADRIGRNAVIRTTGGQVKVGQVGGTLHCYSGGGFIRVEFAGGETWCDTAGGDISVGHVNGSAHLTTAGGNIEVQRAAGAVSARSLSGLIEIHEAGGLVTAIARGGSIQIGSARGARCEASGGAIKVRTVDGPLSLNAVGGNVYAQMVSAGKRALESSFVSSDAGDVTILIPSDLAVSIWATNETPGMRGRIISDFSEIRVMESRVAAPVRASGDINGGGPVLRVSTGSGNIFLRRQK